MGTWLCYLEYCLVGNPDRNAAIAVQCFSALQDLWSAYAAKHTAASQCRCSVHYTAVRSVICCKVGIRHFKGSAWSVCSIVSILHMECNTLQVKHNVLQRRVQCTWEWSAMRFKRSVSMKYQWNALHFDLGPNSSELVNWISHDIHTDTCGNVMSQTTWYSSIIEFHVSRLIMLKILKYHAEHLFVSQGSGLVS